MLARISEGAGFDMEADQQLARDRHVEIIGAVKDLRTEINAMRLEAKTDLAMHSQIDLQSFSEVRQDINSLKGWKTKTATLGSLALVLVTTGTAFASAALASGRF